MIKELKMNDYIKILEGLTIMDCIVNEGCYDKSETELKYLFIDLDGTIRGSIDNTKFPRKGYAEKYPRRPPCSINEVNIFPSINEKLAAWSAIGYRIIGMTNQSGVEYGPDKGGITVETSRCICEETVKQTGLLFPVIFAPCKSINKEVMELRKPKTGMVKMVEDLYGPINKPVSYLIGDYKTDIEMGITAGLNTFKVMPSKNGKDFPFPKDVL